MNFYMSGPNDMLSLSLLFTFQQKLQPNPCYLTKQKNITSIMRRMLIDWLVAVHHNFDLQCETLFLTTSIIDRFLGVS